MSLLKKNGKDHKFWQVTRKSTIRQDKKNFEEYIAEGFTSNNKSFFKYIKSRK